MDPRTDFMVVSTLALATECSKYSLPRIPLVFDWEVGGNVANIRILRLCIAIQPWDADDETTNAQFVHGPMILSVNSRYP